MAPTPTEPTRKITPYMAPMPSSDTILATITRIRRGVARNVAVIVLCRYSEPMPMTPIASVIR